MKGTVQRIFKEANENGISSLLISKQLQNVKE